MKDQRRLLALVLMILAGFVPASEACMCTVDWAEEFRITEEPTATFYGLDLDGDIAVWRDNRRGGGVSAMDIYGYDFATESEFPVAVGGSVQRYVCRVSGRLVVWAEVDGGQQSVWCRNLDGGSAVRLVGPNPFDTGNPMIDGAWIGWQLRVGGVWDVYAGRLGLDASNTPYFVEGPFEVAVTPGVREELQLISGDKLYYEKDQDGGYIEIWEFDLVTKTASCLPIPLSCCPVVKAVEGDTMLLAVHLPGAPYADLYIYDLSTGEMSPPIATCHRGADMSCGIVVYTDASDNFVYAHDPVTDCRFKVSPNEAAETFGGPFISGKKVIWKVRVPPASYAHDFIYSNTLSCETTAPLDIKPGSCPNPLNRDSHGVLPVALVGTECFDTMLVDASSVRLSRADGVGGEVAPNEGPPGPHSVFEDVATPFDGQLCDCHELEGDGIIDLMMHFRTDDVVEALELDDLDAGATVELMVTGELLDGMPFDASDCIVIVPPWSPPGLLDSQANATDVPGLGLHKSL